MGDSGRGAEYEAGLDGLRAVAVVAVVLFHSEFGWARGGFLGVSVFFTLSGFLITRLLLIEHDRSGSIGLRRFWSRRIRRLAPASLLCLAVVAVCIPWFAASARIATVRGDLLASLGYSANWRFVAANQSYADLFVGGPSPVLHFWSLAIEEQFYIVYPVVVAAVLWVATRLRRSWIVAAALAALAIASLTAGFLTNDRDLYYYGTHTRAIEFLIGALGALLWVRSEWVTRAVAARGGRAVAAVALVGCAGTVVLLSATRQSDGWLYRGGFPALAVLWLVLIAGAMTPGVIRSLLSMRPMVAVGRLSFGIYLFHWPIFQLITPSRLHTSDWRLHVVRWVVTLAVAATSYAFVEQPFRIKRLAPQRWVGGVAFLSAIALVALLAQVIPPPSSPAEMAMVDAPDEVVSFADSPAGSAAAPAVTVADATAGATPRVPVVVVLGSEPGRLTRSTVADAPAALVAATLPPTATLPPAAAPGFDVVDLAIAGCSFLHVDGATSAAGSSRSDCRGPAETLAAYVRGGGAVDAVVLTFGISDHVAVAERLAAGMVAGIPGVASQRDAVEVDLDVLGSLSDLGGGASISVVDHARTEPDPLTRMLLEVSTTYPKVAMVAPTDLAAVLARETLPTANDQQRALVRIMVVGDSTSFGVAEQLDDLAADRYEVLWAGRRNCPFVAATHVRWWEGAEFDMSDCLDAQEAWPQVAADFRPDVILVVASLPELSDQQYVGDDQWYAIGDPAFEEQHTASLQRLANMVEPRGGLVLVSDAPTSDWTDTDRVEAFNARLDVWLEQLPRAAVLHYGEYVEAAEAHAGHSLRPDNVHLTAEALHSIVADSLLPQIDAAVKSAITSGSPRS